MRISVHDLHNRGTTQVFFSFDLRDRIERNDEELFIKQHRVEVGECPSTMIEKY